MKNLSFKRDFQDAIPLLQKRGVTKAAVFGSFARQEQTNASDLDLLIEFSGNKSLFDLVELKFELEEHFNRPVDLVTYNSLHPLLKDKILSEQVILYG